MDCADQFKALFSEHLRITSPRAVVANGDDRGLGFLRELGELIGRAKDRQAANCRARQRCVGVDEADGVVLPAETQDVQHNLSMSASADDENVHAVVIGHREAGTSTRYFEEGTPM